MPISTHRCSDGLTKLDHIRLGRLYRIPRCCVARWMLDRLTRPSYPSARHRGRRYNAHTVYVPCGIFHRGLA